MLLSSYGWLRSLECELAVNIFPPRDLMKFKILHRGSKPGGYMPEIMSCRILLMLM